MKRFSLFAAILALCVVAVSVRAEDKPKVAMPVAGADGWISLFNGKDTSEWLGLEGCWIVEEGALTCKLLEPNKRQSDAILIASKDHPEKFANFELRYSFKWVTKTGNSGVQFRGEIDNPAMLHVGGYQADTDPSNGYTGIIYCEGKVAGGRGIMSKRGEKTVWDKDNKRTDAKLAMPEADIKKAIKPVGEWNDCVVVADGTHIVYSINGVVTTDLTDESPKGKADGLIALQMHAGPPMTIQFKDIKIKMLEAKK
ncbi:MAG: DUF1080 domain-containing protein [Planctomycetota bacterium]